MAGSIRNLVFSGGGVLGISYLGALDYLFHHNLMKNIQRTAGTSAGAIAACITSFNLPFEKIYEIVNTLDYSKVPSKEDYPSPDLIPKEIGNALEAVFDDINCLYRLITRYGWFSSEYFYRWLQKTIAAQFNHKKKPPYTFADFKNPSLHKDSRVFHDLYVIGTNVTAGTSQTFSFETTPGVEVAMAVRISMSIPLFFEAIRTEDEMITGLEGISVFCDGGVMNNYPIRLFDSLRFNPRLLRGANMETLGFRFQSGKRQNKITNLLDYVICLAGSSGRIQQEDFYNSPMDRMRSVNINPMNVSPVDFSIITKDETWEALYRQGYLATEEYFAKK